MKETWSLLKESEMSREALRLLMKRTREASAVIGSAGSGIFVVASAQAKKIVMQGKECVIVVPTKRLYDHFVDATKSWDMGNLHIYPYERYRVWQRSADYLIVYGCLDFMRCEIEEIRKHCKCLLLFGVISLGTEVFALSTMSVKEVVGFVGGDVDYLFRDFHLPREIAALAVSISRRDSDWVDRCVKNVTQRPVLIKTNSFEEQLDRIVEIVLNSELADVGIVLPYQFQREGKNSVEYVSNYVFGKGVGHDGLDILTWEEARYEFFSTVFIPCNGWWFGSEELTRWSLCSAITCCSERLYLTYSVELSRFFPREDSPLYF